jgi:phenylalanyl-tRNA synthetase alpha chain
MEENLETIIEQVRSEVAILHSRSELETLKARILGPKGVFTQIRKTIGKLSKEQRPHFGKRVNEVKTHLEALFMQALRYIEEAEITALLGSSIDPTLPAPDPKSGTLHLLTQVREKIVSVFQKVGFTIAEGTEVETDYYCFEALNFPKNHPARDMQDTYLFPQKARFGNISKHTNENYLLRTHTSTVQIRTMLAESPPLRIISSGRCFRRDTVDATHSANFHQIEGLYVDKHVTVKDLKAILDYFVRKIFGKNAQIRFRPSFFPFTEPSYEMDFRLPGPGKGNNQWLEIMGCGLVHPAVFEAVNLDPAEWTGYAFGMGVERIAMLLYGVDDIRSFYQNDLRFLTQFN